MFEKEAVASKFSYNKGPSVYKIHLLIVIEVLEQELKVLLIVHY